MNFLKCYYCGWVRSWKGEWYCNSGRWRCEWWDWWDIRKEDNLERKDF